MEQIILAGLKGKMTVAEYFDEWIERHGRANLRPSSVATYRCITRNYIVPYVGQVALEELDAPKLDDLLGKLIERDLAPSVVRQVRKTLSCALEHARKYQYIESNPTKNLITRMPKERKTPDPYTVQQLQLLLSRTAGTRWEMPILLAGLYGLRLGEVLGLRWDNVDLDEGVLRVCEQLPYRAPAGVKRLDEMAPVKSQERELPITDAVRPYFIQHKQLQGRQMALAKLGGGEYYDNRLVVCAEDGVPYRRERVSTDFGHLLPTLGMPHIRFHDLRHSAATNMHELTGDFFTVGYILGHSLHESGQLLGMARLDAVTARYVNVRIDRKRLVLETYHNAVLPQPEKRKVSVTRTDRRRNVQPARTDRGGTNRR